MRRGRQFVLDRYDWTVVARGFCQDWNLLRIALIKIGALGDVLSYSDPPGPAKATPRNGFHLDQLQRRGRNASHHPDVSRAVDIEEPMSAAWRTGSCYWVISLDDDRIACKLASDLRTTRLPARS